MLDWSCTPTSSIAGTRFRLRSRSLDATEFRTDLRRETISWRAVWIAAVFLASAYLTACREPVVSAHELAITSDEYGYHMPDSVPAGLVHITLHNAGHDIHEAVLVHFTDT